MNDHDKFVAETSFSKTELRQIVQDQIIQCLNRFYAIETGLWGKPINALILRTIIQGHLQKLPYDLSSLSESLELPLTTVHRKVHDLIDAGYIEQANSGRSMPLLPTEKTKASFNKSFGEMMDTIARLYNKI